MRLCVPSKEQENYTCTLSPIRAVPLYFANVMTNNLVMPIFLVRCQKT